MTPRWAMLTAVVIVVGTLSALSWLVGLRSEKWSNRIAFVAVIAIIQGAVMMWTLPGDGA